MKFRFLTIFGLLIFASACTSDGKKVSDLLPRSIHDFEIMESEVQSVPMVGFVDFNERIEVSMGEFEDRCEFATYEFQFEYGTTVYVEFRDSLPGSCSYGAVLVKSFDVKVLAEESFPIGEDFDPFIQYQQRNAHSGVFQIGTAFFHERVSDLRSVEILCRGDSCTGSVERRDYRRSSASIG